MLADFAAAVGEAVGKLFVGGEEQKARGFGTVRAEYDSFGFLALNVPLCVEINGSGGAAVVVELDAVNVRIRADFAAAGFFGHADGGGQRTGFCSDFAGEC